MNNDLTTVGRGAVQWREPERVIAVLRVLVVVSLAALVVFGTPINRTYLTFGCVLIVLAGAYAIFVLLANFRGRALSQGWMTAFDGVLTALLTAATGGASSVVVALIPLAVVASAVRQGLRPAILAALGTGALFAAATLTVSRPGIPLPHRIEVAVWWCCYFVAFAVLTGSLRRVLDQEHERTVRAKAEVMAEHAEAAEERDLRARLLQVQRLREEGLRVVLHEFRTPVSSLAALARSLTVPGRLDAGHRDEAITLMAAHARHLTDMLDGLADLAIQTGSPRGAPRIRRTVVRDLAQASLTAAGVPTEHSTISVEPPGAVIDCDEHRVRRIMTNLLENAHRHGSTSVIDLSIACTRSWLTLEVGDRGPGLLSTKRAPGIIMASSDERTASEGLGLWIVEQLVSALGGTFSLQPREGGGLLARVAIPLS
jgi:K+-sensing histidine kinase KdpD